MKNFHAILALLGMLLTAVIVRGGEGPSLSIERFHSHVVIDVENNTNGCKLEHSVDLKNWLTVYTRPHSILLAWDASPSTNVTGYNIYWGPLTRTYTNHVTVSSNVLSVRINNLPRGVDIFYSATAFNSVLESVYSNEVTNAAIIAVPARLGREFFRMRKVNQ
jgi:hypothetical protein